MKIIGSSYILFFFKQLDLGSILASLNLSLFVEALKKKKKKKTQAPPQSCSKQKPSKEARFISVKLRELIYTVHLMSYQTDLKCYKYHDRNTEMWKYLRQSNVEKGNHSSRVLSMWLI